MSPIPRLAASLLMLLATCNVALPLLNGGHARRASDSRSMGAWPLPEFW
jgi:hypothetical protein